MDCYEEGKYDNGCTKAVKMNKKPWNKIKITIPANGEFVWNLLRFKKRVASATLS